MSVRATLRLLAIALITLLLAPWLVPGLLIGWVWPKGGWYGRGLVVKCWSRWVRRVMGMRVKVVGTPPRPPFILVANHLGYADILLLCGNLPAWYIAKSDVRHWPVMGLILRGSNVLFIDRTRRSDVRRMNHLMEHQLDRGMPLVFFPEGTSWRGDQVLPFKPSLLQLAAGREFPVHMAVLRYETPDSAPPAGHCVAWWGDTDFVPHFKELLEVKTFSAELHFLETPIVEKDRKQLATQLHQTIDEHFRPMQQDEAGLREPLP